MGYSGGLDSAVLLHLLARAELPVTAVHVNHGISPQADNWQAHCETFAKAMGVPFIGHKVQVCREDGGLEQAARSARYRVFEKVMAPGDQILLAHHGDDQTETLLLRLMRGAGIEGLAAMDECRALSEGRSVLRPLLRVSREELELYARAQGLAWIEDESNADLAFDRNYIRSQVVPALTARWPVVNRVSRAVENLRESAGLLQDIALDDLRGCAHCEARFGESIDLQGFRALSVPRQKNLLRMWIRQLGGRMPESAQLQEGLEQVRAAADAQPAVTLGDLVLRRYRDRLYLTPQLQPLSDSVAGETVWRWDGMCNLELTDGWTLQPDKGWPAGEYTVHFRRGGERARPSSRSHSQTLKKLLQEYALEPWLRGLVPLIYTGDELVAVGDLFVTAKGPSQPPIWRFLD
ncbi:tRNA lysidine(34) synthetase TilS [Microbulbifer mangrovi]|uniref:tRNA lysidine(34) synthetase TilS n=1 Tax=Microbulbifer mangrovi TaxID=927787 RepID=UPI00099063D1|nr:tRNA lysidine(34) synthetase TilS [Microbulbifer mangrovi]